MLSLKAIACGLVQIWWTSPADRQGQVNISCHDLAGMCYDKGECQVQCGEFVSKSCHRL